MKTITIICDDHIGVLAEITDRLKKKNINIEDISAQSLGERGAVVISVSGKNKKDAIKALKDAGFIPLIKDSLVIKIKDRPGELARIAKKLQKEKINVETMHIISQEDGSSFVALITNHPVKTKKILKDIIIK